jgi:hypothetical protein
MAVSGIMTHNDVDDNDDDDGIVCMCEKYLEYKRSSFKNIIIIIFKRAHATFTLINVKCNGFFK